MFGIWLLIASCLATVVVTQGIGFTIFPQQVVTGRSYTVAWLSNGQPATIALLRNGQLQDTLFTSDGSINTFTWQVEDDYDFGTNYALQFVSGTTTIAPRIDMIEDEDGLVAGGSTILAPAPTATIVSATAISAGITTGVTTSLTTATGTTATIPPASSTNPAAAAASSSNSGLSPGVIAAIVIGVSGILSLGGVGFWYYRRRRAQRARSPDDPDPIGSFLALGKKGGRRTIKGTSPEYPAKEKFVADPSDGENGHLVGGTKGSDAGVSELHGQSHHSWNELEGGPDPSLINGVFEADGKPIIYELDDGGATSRH